MLFFYIRHGDPCYHPDSLTPLGERQAEALARRLAAHGLDRIYTSGSERAIATARPTAQILKKEIVPLDWCTESYTHRAMTVVDGDGRKKWFFNDPETVRLFGTPQIRRLGMKWTEHDRYRGTLTEEHVAATADKIDVFFAELGYEHDRENCIWRAVRPNDERVALFAHQGFGLLFLSLVLDIPYPMLAVRADMGHSGMTVIEFGDTHGVGGNGSADGYSVPRMLQLSNDSHIWEDSLPVKYQNRLFF